MTSNAITTDNTELASLGITKIISNVPKASKVVAMKPATADSLITTDLVIPESPDVAKFLPSNTFKTVGDLPAKKEVLGYTDWPDDHPASRFLQKKKDDYVFKPILLANMIAFNKLHEPGDNMLICGPTGCGKSTIIRQYHASLNIPLVCVSVNEDTRFEKLLGRTVFTKENGIQVMKYVLGPLGIALYLDIPILIDEAHKMSPTQATGLHAIMDGEPIAIDGDGGTVLKPGKNFRMYMSGNTAFGNDFSRLYRGSKTQDIALLDRVIILYDSYPTEAEQMEILSLNKFGKILPEDTRKSMVKTACSIQKAFIESSRESGSGSLTKTLSVRKLLKWAKQTVSCDSIHKKTAVKPIVRSLDQILLAACTESEAFAILQILSTHLQGDDSVPNEDEFIRQLASSMQDPKGLDVDLNGVS